MDYLGSGARSTIWRVRDCRDNSIYALKRIVREKGDDGRFFGQATNEFEIARRFDHPAIRKCYRLNRRRWFFSVSELHLLMEFCPGSSVQATRPKQVLSVLEIFLGVAQALAHMHARGFIHADMKPNNIIVGDDGAVKIIDFGQSCALGTIKQRIQGTPDFIAPEQVLLRPLDARTDIFNFGAALYWALTGIPIPTLLPKMTNQVMMATDLRLRPVEEINPEVPAGLSKLVADCIEMEQSRRPSSVRELIGRLELIAHTCRRNAPGAEKT
jgi:serine/threonine-protein kinase